MMKNLIFLGAPGAGKGTMAEKLSSTTTIQHISTGAILRDEITGNTKLGLEVKDFMAKGELVPDEIVASIVAGKLASEETRHRGFILDGFPRTENQAKILSDLLILNKIEIDGIILFDVSKEILVKRLTGRRVCKDCGSTLHHMLYNPPIASGVCDKCKGYLYQREDDNESTAIDRLKIYEELTAPVIDFYGQSGKLITINAEASQADVFAELLKTLNN
ncbi:MAG: adenylate kinase [Lentisphaeria bacterium]